VTVTVSQLRAVTTLLLKRLDERVQGNIETSADYYWNIDASQKYDKTEVPDDLDVGQLSEDWSSLQELADGKSEPVVYGLVWLGEILKYIGETIGD
jgi:hypothetical protein